MAYINNYDDLLRDIQASGQTWSTYDLELAKNNPDAGRSIYTQKLAHANAQTDAERQAANDAAEMIRRQYGGYTAGSDGSGYSLTGTPANQQVPSYTQYASKYQSQIDDLMAQLGNRDPYNSQYQGQIDTLMNQLMNREAFSYNPTDDPSYSAYSEHYRNAGNQAREDTLAQAAAMVGGQPSTYAIAAANQAQNAYNAQMSDIIPQLREAAYSMYMDEANTMRNNMNSLMALDQAAYGKYMDQSTEMYNLLQSLMALDESDYNKHQNDYANQLTEWEANYGAAKDLLEYMGTGDSVTYTGKKDDTEADRKYIDNYAEFYWEIEDALENGQYDLAKSKFAEKADLLTDYQYKNLMRLFDQK